jgi:hypothetical protein
VTLLHRTYLGQYLTAINNWAGSQDIHLYNPRIVEQQGDGWEEKGWVRFLQSQ